MNESEDFAIKVNGPTETLMVLNYLTKVMGYKIHPDDISPEEYIDENGYKYQYIYHYHDNDYICGTNSIHYAKTFYNSLEDYVRATTKISQYKLHCQTFKRKDDALVSEKYCFNRNTLKKAIDAVEGLNIPSLSFNIDGEDITIGQAKKLLELE